MNAWRRAFLEDHAAKVSRDIASHYGIETFPRGTMLLISETNMRDLDEIVWADRTINAVGRGYYLGSAPFIIQPDWMFDPLSVATARLIAVLWKASRLDRPMRRLAAWLERIENEAHDRRMRREIARAMDVPYAVIRPMLTRGDRIAVALIRPFSPVIRWIGRER